jgi:predicted Rossmann-fold nucleotide-binding protein
MLTFASQAYIFLPGGFGTLDEFFEILTLVQTRKIKNLPIILVHKDYWEPLVGWFEAELYKKRQVIYKHDLKSYNLVNNTKEALVLLEKLDKT